MNRLIGTDPLSLVAVESGLVRAPRADAPAQGDSKLDVPQRAAVIGEPVPIVFCRREFGRGGVLISPPATECRFENDASNNLTASYHLVLGEGQMGGVQVRDVFQRSCRVGTHTQTYDRRAGTWEPGNYITNVNETNDPPTNYSIQEASYHCGSVGLYTGMSTLSFEVTTPDGSDQWNRQVHVFIRNGMEVDRLTEDDTDSSNNYADLVLWSLINCSRLPEQMRDMDRLTTSAEFLKEYNLNCDIYLKESSSLSDFLAKTAAYFLVAETRDDGKYGLRPLLPLNNDYTIKTTAISPVFTFTEDHVDPDSFELSYIPLSDRKPFCVQILWRQQFDDDFGIVRSSEVRYENTALDGPYEQHDLSEFCTYEPHAIKVAAYILARRRHIAHTLRIALTGFDFTEVTLYPGDIVRVNLQRSTHEDGATAHNFLYEVARITKTLMGKTQLELTHFPVDASGASLVAIDVANAEGSGILLEKNSDVISCDVNSSTDLTIPDEEFTTGFDLDPGGELVEPEPEAVPEAVPEDGEPTTCAIYFHSIAWEDDTTLVVKVRVSPTGLAPEDGSGNLTATLSSGTVVAVDRAGRAINPQPGTLPSLSFTGTVALEYTAENYPDDNVAEPLPSDRIIEGEFQIDYSLSDFPVLDEENYVEFRMPVLVSSTSGGFDEVTVLNSAVAVFEPKVDGGGNGGDALLLLHMDGSNNSTTFTDSSPNSLTVTAHGNAKISTADPKFGTGAGLFDGNGDYLTVDDPSLALGTGNFTIEAWVKVPSDHAGAGYTALCMYPELDDDTGLYVYVYPNGNCTIMWFDGINNDSAESNDHFSLNEWAHIAVVRESGVVYLYVNGIKQVGGDSSYSNQPSLTSSVLSIARSGFTNEDFKGKIDELRIKDTAVYTANFTPPTAPFD